MDSPIRRRVSVGLMEQLEANLDCFPRYQAYLREHRPPTLIVWGPEDGYVPRAAAGRYGFKPSMNLRISCRTSDSFEMNT
jgi:pimeloyl-ACP methyl ester carboxylesterase